MTNTFKHINFDLNGLPTMPLVAEKMMDLLNRPESSAEEMADVISKDVAVSAQVLKIANSPFYSMSRNIRSLTTAIVILGEKTLRNLVLAASMQGINRSYGAVEKMLWEDSMVCALGSRFMSSRFGIADPEEAFIAGLFRHIGLVVLNSQKAKAGDFIVSSLHSQNQDMAAQERELFGATHAEIGAAVLEHWKLSDVLSLVALHHSDGGSLQGIDDNTLNLIALINVSGLFSGYLGLLGTQRELNLENRVGLKKLDLEHDKVEEAMTEFKGIFDQNRNDFLS